MTQDPRPDEQLLAEGGEDAFTVFYRRHAESLLVYAMRRTGDAEVAADIVAETFATVLAKSDRFSPTRGSAVNWLYGIAGKLILRYFERRDVERRARQRLGIPRIALDDDAVARIESLAAIDSVRVQEELESLPPEQHAAIRARVFDDRSYEEIASSMNITPVTARQRVSRGLARLRTALGGSR